MFRRQIGFRGDELVFHLCPGAVEFFAHKLGEAGQRALSHFGAGDTDHDCIVRVDHHPDADFRRATGGVRPHCQCHATGG